MVSVHEVGAALMEPVWEFACLFPAQGQWDEDYFAVNTASIRKPVFLNIGWVTPNTIQLRC